MHPLPTASVLGKRYSPHIEDICRWVADIAARFRPLSPLLMLVWVRVRRTVMRLDSLALRSQQGRLRPARPARHRVRTSLRTPPTIHPGEAWRVRRAPQGHAWLIRLYQPCAQFIPRIEMLVNDPEIAALCAATPQAGKLLRPLCRMFGLTPPPYIFKPPAPRKPKPKKPKAPKPAPFAEHLPNVWPFVPLRLRLRVPGLRPQGLRRPKPPA